MKVKFIVLAISSCFLFSSFSNAVENNNFNGPSVWPLKKNNEVKTEKKLTKIKANIEMKVYDQKYLINWNGTSVMAVIPDNLFKEEITPSTMLEMTGVMEKEWHSAMLFKVTSIKIIN